MPMTPRERAKRLAQLEAQAADRAERLAPLTYTDCCRILWAIALQNLEIVDGRATRRFPLAGKAFTAETDLAITRLNALMEAEDFIPSSLLELDNIVFNLVPPGSPPVSDGLAYRAPGEGDHGCSDE